MIIISEWSRRSRGDICLSSMAFCLMTFFFGWIGFGVTVVQVVLWIWILSWRSIENKEACCIYRHCLIGRCRSLLQEQKNNSPNLQSASPYDLRDCNRTSMLFRPNNLQSSLCQKRLYLLRLVTLHDDMSRQLVDHNVLFIHS